MANSTVLRATVAASRGSFESGMSVLSVYNLLKKITIEFWFVR